jgi:hypothetical protein
MRKHAFEQSLHRTMKLLPFTKKLQPFKLKQLLFSTLFQLLLDMRIGSILNDPYIYIYLDIFVKICLKMEVNVG